ncbi:MAG: cysteine synthase A [Candidatus Eremiobacteraeota bacterium]|nr:cysteine synthase A [Candidatus Eremiobacteraeota bacterium]
MFPTLGTGESSAAGEARRVGFWESVGNTPLIELGNVSAKIGRRVLAKAEFLNPGGSVKDRAAKGIVAAAETAGTLRPGGTVVEGTAGNTGIALALISNERGYACTIVVPDDQSPEKISLLKTFGADVRVVRAVPFADPENYYHVAKRIAAATRDAIWCDQFENAANREAHERTTGPEIWEQCGGVVDAFVASAGTGGTFAGVSRALKQRNSGIQTVLCDPMGSALYAYVSSGELQFEGDSDLEGIGIKRITANFSGAPVDRAIRVADRDAIAMTRWLLRHEGIFVGGSSGLNVLAAVRVAKELPKGSTVVTILCDGGARYLSRLFDQRWLEERRLSDDVPELE